MTADIAAFIRARLDEWEAPTWRLAAYYCPPGCCAPEGYVGHECLICRTTEYGGTVASVTEIAQEHDEQIHQRASGLRQVAALRAVVDEYAARDEDVDLMLGHGAPLRQREWSGLRLAVRALATIWADHPDYAEEWKP